jgi:CheY-like chemotaxis protein
MAAIRLLEEDTGTHDDLLGLRVLVIDDDADTRELIKTILNDAGAEVDCAASVRQAFELLAVARPQVIISDIEMPEENGYSFLRNLRSVLDEDGGKTPAIALTGRALPEDRARALASGFNLHMAKPTTPAALLQALRALASP